MCGLLPIAEKIQQCGIEPRRILQKRKMAGIRQDQQAGAGNGCCDIIGVLALDAFIMVAIHDHDRRFDGAELRVRPVRLVLPHLADLLLKRIVLIRPTDRHELPALKAGGFTGYLIKPVRAASLAARLTAEDTFELSPAEIEVETAEAAPANKGLSILVAEDNEINALLARALLTRLGHRPTIATNGEAAVESWLAARASGSPYDLVLMDVQMPGMDGLEAARLIRAAEAQGGDKHTPMLALTANVQIEDREAALAAGLDGLLVKPLDRERQREVLEAGFGTAANPLAA